MFHGHKYNVTFFLLLYYFPLICILLAGEGLQVGKASSSDFYFGGGAAGGGSSSSKSGSNGNDRQKVAGARDTDISSSSSSSAASPSNSEDSLRREFIKVQILQRLGLSEKPHVDMAHKISKDLVLETLRRTENLNYYHDSSSSSTTDSSSANHNERHVPSHSSSNPNNSTTTTISTIHLDEETGVANYAKTSEIISFPDKGPVLNGHNLLTFSYAGSQAFGVGVRVKKAHLWVKLDYRSSIGRHFGHLLTPKGITLYVFQVHGNFSTHSSSSSSSQSQQTVHLNIRDVNLELAGKRTISLDSLGWQKLDVTSAVQKWYGKQSRHRIRHANRHHNHRDKLTLLVDCSGCGYCIQPIIFSRENTVISTNANDDENNGDESEDQVGETADDETETQSSYWSSGVTTPSRGGGESDTRHNHLEQPSSHLRSHNNFENDNSNPDYYDQVPPPSLNSGGHGPNKVDNFTEMPFLVLETESAPNFKRSRRRALECSPRVKHCCKQRFYISFKDLDWDDWIIAPRGYYANYCRGSCGGPHRTPDTFLNYHTHVLEEYRRTPEGQVNLSGITPCCAPTKFAPMSLIYFGPDLNIIKRDLPKMIVEECGCP